MNNFSKADKKEQRFPFHFDFDDGEQSSIDDGRDRNSNSADDSGVAFSEEHTMAIKDKRPFDKLPIGRFFMEHIERWVEVEMNR